MFLAEIDRLLSPWSIVLLICLICYRNIRVLEQAAGVMESQQVKAGLHIWRLVRGQERHNSHLNDVWNLPYPHCWWPCMDRQADGQCLTLSILFLETRMSPLVFICYQFFIRCTDESKSYWLNVLPMPWCKSDACALRSDCQLRAIRWK